MKTFSGEGRAEGVMGAIVADGGGAHEASLRATLRRWSLARLPCAARAGRGLAKLGYASNNASPDPPAAALLGTAQGWHGAKPHALWVDVGRRDYHGALRGHKCVLPFKRQSTSLLKRIVQPFIAPNAAQILHWSFGVAIRAHDHWFG